jgi:tetratricopeptide (TPR) repeat protein
MISPSHPVTDRGKNSFTSYHFHFNGYLSPNQQTTATFQYQSRDNCWFPNGSASYNITTPNVAFNYLPIGLFCQDVPAGVDIIINDLGDGVYDTILISVPDSFAEPELDEMYYAQAQDLVSNANYYNATQNLKWLINDCMESPLVYEALYDLYKYYSNMDTSSNPGISYGLWNELYDFLLLKVEQYVENYDFQDLAYNIAIMCEINMQEYEDAMSKYERIILNHPDPVQRLLASWDYDALIELLDSLDGEGGSFKSFEMNMENTLASPGENFNDLKPVERILRESYRERRVEEREMNEEKVTVMLRGEANERSKTGVLEEMRKEGINRDIESRARMNMMQSRYLSREEKENRMMEDINLMIQLMDGNVKGMESPGFTPQTYKLEQNYPNPFNPSTIISFSIPTASLVKLNVYDITGRLIKVLSNEIKEVGIHNITFDGSGLASGVYFYKIEAGNYNQTKRMVMIK